MAASKSQKIQAEIEKVKAKINEQQARLKELEKNKLEAENSEIVDIVRGLSISLEELPLVLQQLREGTSGQSVQRPYRQAASALCGCWPFPLSILFSEGGILCRHRSNTKASSKLPFLVIGRSPSRMLPPFTRRRSGTNVTVRSSGGCLMCL